VQDAEPDQPEDHRGQRCPYGDEKRAAGREREQRDQPDPPGYGNRYGRHVLLRYLVALALTLAVEVPLYTLALRYAVGVGVRRAVCLAVAVNLGTHPVLWWSLTWWSYPLLAAEAGACLVEWALLRWWVGRDGVLLAVITVGVNAASLAVGLVLTP
jgi:hypothetical protein